ncbi:hypothetical protein C2E23DRAFT_745444 [Lenzites betulinus]|nr:hypothetical protein C2E23DRAFT_745444 [Lenzites betulinus]
MLRFLNTYTGEFVWIVEIGATPYTILSHTWRSDEEGGEQTYADIRACEVARKTRFRLIWIGSCCIDKRSSAELSESINSMYALYREADVCYVYLADVPRDTDPREKDSEFWRSRWHKRGWTLQELVAPPYVVFLTCDWTFLGTKTGLASTLEKITGVDAVILLGMKPVESASVAKRMSWAAERETTRVEDRAYSLLGIFGVHMSPIYGEGTNAFLRLQEEIIKHIPDQSIFAWGRSRTLLAPDKVADDSRGPWEASGPGLLASSPEAFCDVGDAAPITASDFAMCIGHLRAPLPPPLHCVFTPQGARIKLMTIPLPPDTARILDDSLSGAACDDCSVANARSPFRRLALLRCTDRDGHMIGLPLCCPEDVAAAENVVIGMHATCGAPWHTSPRVVRLSAAMLKDLDVAPTYVEVSLLRHSKQPVKPKACRPDFAKAFWEHPLLAWRRDAQAPSIRLAPNCEEELGAVGFTLTPLAVESRQPEGTRSAEFILSTALNMNSMTQQPDQRMLPYMLIELGVRRERQYHGVPIHFTVEFLHRPSVIESVHPASLAPDGHLCRTPLHDETCPIPPMVGNSLRKSRSFDIEGLPSSRTTAEAQFLIPYCTGLHTDAGGDSMDCVRLLRLKLECPLESAYVEHWDHLLLSVELSEPFNNSIASTQPEAEPAATLIILAPSQHLADHSLIQAAPEGPSPDSEATPPPPTRPNATHDSPDPALFSTATSEQTAVCKRSGAPPGPCDSAVHDAPDIVHADSTNGAVPSSPHDTMQHTMEPATSPTATFEHRVVREAPSLARASSTVMAVRLSEHLVAGVTGINATSLQNVSEDLDTHTEGFVIKPRQNDTIASDTTP